MESLRRIIVFVLLFVNIVSVLSLRHDQHFLESSEENEAETYDDDKRDVLFNDNLAIYARSKRSNPQQGSSKDDVNWLLDEASKAMKDMSRKTAWERENHKWETQVRRRPEPKVTVKPKTNNPPAQNSGTQSAKGSVDRGFVRLGRNNN